MLTEWFKLKFKFVEVVEGSELSTADDDVALTLQLLVILWSLVSNLQRTDLLLK
jgi:hypothetical protein